MVDVDSNQLLNPDALPSNFDPNWLTELSQLNRPRLLVHKNTYVAGPLLTLDFRQKCCVISVKTTT